MPLGSSCLASDHLPKNPTCTCAPKSGLNCQLIHSHPFLAWFGSQVQAWGRLTLMKHRPDLMPAKLGSRAYGHDTESCMWNFGRASSHKHKLTVIMKKAGGNFRRCWINSCPRWWWFHRCTLVSKFVMLNVYNFLFNSHTPIKYIFKKWK